MTQLKILLDTNAYFRLANSLHPLLFVPFGEEDYCLYVIDDFEKELERSPRLTNKFSWAYEEQYKENRRHHITISKKQKAEIENTYDFIWNSFKETGVSPVDVKAVAVAFVLEIELISDDRGVQEVADAYDVVCHSSIHLLHRMYICQHINLDTVHQVIEYLQFNEDTCASFPDEYEQLFQEPFPVFQASQ